MTLPFFATLQTTRALERPVIFHGSTAAYITSITTQWLEANGEHGDSFSLYELVKQPIGSVVCAKPSPIPVEPEWRGHPYKDHGGRCDLCGATYQEHLKENK